MTENAAWIDFGASLLLFAIYEARAIWLGRTRPEAVARYVHARMRADWVRSISLKPGFEIVAVQALRNSLMSATIAASTAALALLAAVGVTGAAFSTRAPAPLVQLGVEPALELRLIIESLLVLVLFAAYICSSMAMRYFNHATYAMSVPVEAPERAALTPMAITYVERAGLLYSWGLRCFLIVVPLVAGLVNPLAMPVATIVLVVVLWLFDRPPAITRAA